MSFLHEYPYTDFHELNLDWLLKNYQKLINDLNEINSWISEHKIEYTEALERLAALEHEINTFESEVEYKFNNLSDSLENEIQAAINQMNAEVDGKIVQLENEVNTAISDMQGIIDALRLQILNELTAFKTQINNEIIQIRSYVNANNEYMRLWVENRIQDFINSLPEILTVMVYNPYRGEITDIQTAINDLYSIVSIYGLTAQQYDDLGLTASEYDNYELTAFEYDAYGYKLLGYPDLNYYMISPFTGEYTPVKDVVLRLCYFHMEGLTAQEYDDKELTASDYDALDITAFDYDWFGEQLIA